MDRLDKLITERKQHMNIIKFEDLPISDDIKRAVIEMGFEEPSPIQSQYREKMLSGKLKQEREKQQHLVYQY